MFNTAHSSLRFPPLSCQCAFTLTWKDHLEQRTNFFHYSNNIKMNKLHSNFSLPSIVN